MEPRYAAAARLAPYRRDNTPAFSLRGSECWARLVGAHDGDTVTVVLEAFPGRFQKANIRLRGIDTCEMTSTDPVLKGRAVAARDRVIELLTGGGVRLQADVAYSRGQIDAALAQQVYTVWVCCFEQDKYGRTLADVYPDCPVCRSANQVLLDEGLACPYDGGHKYLPQVA